jgi:sulfide:quinone oxidoreductase
MANRLRARLPRGEWQITIVDKEPRHYYQPGFLFLPFGIYKQPDVVKPKSRFIPPGVELVIAETELIEPERNLVKLMDGRELGYDYLIVATGAYIQPSENEGLSGPDWRRNTHDFYTPDGAMALAEYLQNWPGGRLVLNVAEMPIKCPVAPIEFLFLADWWFRKRGMRERVELELATPLSGAFTRPICSSVLGHLFVEKDIKLTTDFALAEVDGERRVIKDYAGREIPFDCLVSIPTNMGAPLIERSGLGDELNFVPTNPQTLQAKARENIFVIGDATDLLSSKAGSVAHFQAEILTENIECLIQGQAPRASFDGHTNCFIESGYGKAVLVDFNYDTQPLPGKFPLPGLGPFTLLGVSRVNHWGKLAFRWAYWNLLLQGRSMLIPSHMSLAGKVQPAEPAALEH